MSETEVVVLPSPAGVGVIAVTLISFAVRPVGEAIEDRQVDLRLVAAVQLELVGEDAVLLGELGDGAHAWRSGRSRGWKAWRFSSGAGRASPAPT